MVDALRERFRSEDETKRLAVGMALTLSDYFMFEYPVVKGTVVLMTFMFGAVGVGATADAISPDTHLTLGPVLSVGFVVVCAVIYLTRWMQRVDDSVASLKHEINEIRNNCKACPPNQMTPMMPMQPVQQHKIFPLQSLDDSKL